MRIGAELLTADHDVVAGQSVGLFTNYTGVLPDLSRNIDAFLAIDVPLTTLFTPEHGMWGTAQAGESEPDETDALTGLPIIDTYRKSGPELDALLQKSGVDVALFDMQDIGVRFFTYIWSLYDLMCAAARTSVPVVVLDRPNPLGGQAVAGPGLQESCSSFVGRVNIPLRYGLTVGELARWFNRDFVPNDAGRAAELDVVALQGWSRRDMGTDIDLPWVMPSPNIPTLDSVLAYPGTCLFEGTTMSEGRGSTRPFEMIGAPFVDDRLAPALAERQLPGVVFRDVEFRPMFHKHQGVRVRGVQLHITDRTAFEPVTTGVSMISVLADLYPTEFGWLKHDSARPPFIDLLWGSPALRHGIDDSATVGEIFTASPSAPVAPADVMLYRETTVKDRP